MLIREDWIPRFLLKRPLGKALRLIVVYLAMMGCLSSSIYYFGWLRTWSAVSVPAVALPFADARTLQAGVVAERAGLKLTDLRITNPYDPWRRAFNYPSYMVSIASLLDLAVEWRFLAFCCGLIFIFLITAVSLLSISPSPMLLCALITPSTLLALERGNYDLLVFGLIALTAFGHRLLRFSSLLIAFLLKLFPLFAIALFVVRKRGLETVAFTCVAGMFVLSQASDIAAVEVSTPKSCWISFGFRSIARCGEIFGWGRWPLIGALVLSAVVIVFSLRHIVASHSPLSKRDQPVHDLMILGSSIYVGSFIFASSFDYRMIFLLFCFPYLQKRLLPFSMTILTLILMSMSELLFIAWAGDAVLFVTRPAKVIVFAYLTGYLIFAVATALTASTRDLIAQWRPAPAI